MSYSTMTVMMQDTENSVKINTIHKILIKKTFYHWMYKWWLYFYWILKFCPLKFTFKFYSYCIMLLLEDFTVTNPYMLVNSIKPTSKHIENCPRWRHRWLSGRAERSRYKTTYILHSTYSVNRNTSAWRCRTEDEWYENGLVWFWKNCI